MLYQQYFVLRREFLMAFSTTYFKDIYSDTIFSTTKYVKTDFRSRLAGENNATCMDLNVLLNLNVIRKATPVTDREGP
jgi:hypothetical protein